jgi:hypothetical protein
MSNDSSATKRLVAGLAEIIGGKVLFLKNPGESPNGEWPGFGRLLFPIPPTLVTRGWAEVRLKAAAPSGQM